MGELLKNGDAESGTTGPARGMDHWDIVLLDGVDQRPTRSQDKVYQGDWSFRLKSEWPINESGGMQQSFPVIPGATYELSFRYWSADAEPPFPRTNRLRVMIGLGAGQTETYQIDPVAGSGWLEFRQEFVPFDTEAWVQFRPLPSFAPTAVDVKFWYLDIISVPGLEEPPVLEGPVTIGDVLDSVQYDACDFSPEYRKAARTWLNGFRSRAASEGFWNTSLNGEGTIAVSGTATDGVYPLKDAATPTPNVYAFVAGDYLLDTTNNRRVSYQDRTKIQGIDPDLNETGTPNWWTDYGHNAAGEALIKLHPRPTSAITMKAPMYKRFAALTEDDEGLTVDPFFGSVAVVSGMFLEGLREYQEQNENEQGTDAQHRRVLRIIKKHLSKQAIAFTGNYRLRDLTPRSVLLNVALADPGHYDNPEI